MNGQTESSILGEFYNMGFRLQELLAVDGGCIEVYLKDRRIAVLPPTASKRLIQKECFDVVWGIRYLFETELQPLSFSLLSSSFLQTGGASGRAGSAEPVMEGMNDLKFCRDCIHWQTTSGWKGNCTKHPWPKDKYSQDASPNTMECIDYEDKQIKVTTLKEA